MTLSEALIKSEIISAPEQPGIYIMLDNKKKIIYIGKAKNIKNRLKQYNIVNNKKTAAMVNSCHYINYTITESESDALILEAQLIKKHKPKFNILLKDDKSFPYIAITLDHEYPQLLKYRKNTKSYKKSFGPFASGKQVNITLDHLYKIFQLRSCNDIFFRNRIKPCLQYYIKRCCAPCTKKITKEDYHDRVLQVQAFLEGKNANLQKKLSDKMEALSKEMRYEEAAIIRDQITALSYIQLKADANSVDVGDLDIIALATNKIEYCIQLFIYRAGQPYGNTPYFLRHTEDKDIATILTSFIMQLYQKTKVPKKILVSHAIKDKDLIIKALHKLYNIKVKIFTARTEYFYKLIKTAINNAKISLNNHITSYHKNKKIFDTIRHLFHLPFPIRRIEIYDNSHIQGSFAVGAMVVADITGFNKKEYRKFSINIKAYNKLGGDDYDMIHQVLLKRIEKIKKEPDKIPQLMIIDGGKGHMNIVNKTLNKYNITIPFVCMSKGLERNAGEEQFHIPNYPSFTLTKNNIIMKYLQNLRDEAHNFANRSHRKKRLLAIQHSNIDFITGIGLKRKKALLNYFGSLKQIKSASIDELQKVKGISYKLANSIKSLNKNNRDSFNT